MGRGECEHVEAGPAPIKEKEGSGPGITAHLSLSVLRALITFCSDAVSVTLWADFFRLKYYLNAADKNAKEEKPRLFSVSSIL